MVGGWWRLSGGRWLVVGCCRVVVVVLVVTWVVVVLLVLGCQHILSTYLSPELLKQRQRRFRKVPAASEAVGDITFACFGLMGTRNVRCKCSGNCLRAKRTPCHGHCYIILQPLQMKEVVK